MAFITIQGENLIALKQGNSEVMLITHFVFANIAGLGAEPADRIEAMPAPGNIVHEHAVTQQGYVNANQVVYSAVLDSTIGDFTFNWVGLKASGGELVACAHIPAQIKTANAGGVPGNNLTRNFLLAFSGAAATTAIAVPAETWQIDFTTRLLQIDERERLSNFDIYGQGAFFANGFKVEFVSGTTYKVKAGLGYVGGIRCELLADTNITAAAPPKGVWIDASLQGDINGVTEVVAFNVTAATLTDYTDGLGFKHFVFKIADIPSGGVVTDLRPVAPVYLRRDDIVPQAEAEAGTATTPRAWTAQRVKQAIDSRVPSASETVQGKVEMATAAETLTGTDNTRAVHPAGLQAKFNAFPVASETVQGKVEFATAAETEAGTDNTRAVHPLALRSGFAIQKAQNGYIKLPNWLGGLIVQWMKAVESTNSADYRNWPTPFPNAVLGVSATPDTSPGNSGCQVHAITQTGIVFMAGDTYNNGHSAWVIAIGH
jgi:hypothetical protein